MAVFRVGQRVRLVRHLFGLPEDARFIGSEGVIATPLIRWTWCPAILVHNVRMTNPSAPLPETFNGLMACMPDELEPIVDDGRQVISWSEVEHWNPDHIREGETA